MSWGLSKAIHVASPLRLLAVNMAQRANSGHPDLPLGAAPMAFALWTCQLKHYSANRLGVDRDCFVLSVGHVEKRPSAGAQAIGLPRVGGLRHRYSRSAAA